MNKIGKLGEQIALEYLLSKGFTILHQNWRASHKEIDLIVENQDFLVFVEVKTRKSDRFGQPQEAVNPVKQRKLVQAARAYCRKYQSRKEIRFDIVAITLKQPKTQIKHIENAIFPEYYV